jgi:hypothetical protein
MDLPPFLSAWATFCRWNPAQGYDLCTRYGGSEYQNLVSPSVAAGPKTTSSRPYLATVTSRDLLWRAKHDFTDAHRGARALDAVCDKLDHLL